MRWIRFRLTLLLGCALMLAGCDRKEAPDPPAPDAVSPGGVLLETLWPVYRERFIRDGRVFDLDNSGQTHSEAQGYGMLLAEAAADQETFDQIWQWTQRHLQRRDGLFAWRYANCPESADRGALNLVLLNPVREDALECVTDSNNASDGEILIAWALLRAAQRWNMPHWRQAADAIVVTLAESMLMEHGGYSLLLPGGEGFLHPDSSGRSQVIINPSYWVFPAIELFEARYPGQGWQALADSGRAMLAQMRFAQPGLPPDWLAVSPDGLFALADPYGFERVYGFNAVRVPLHLVWGQPEVAPELLSGYLEWWGRFPDERIPAWMDLEQGEIAPFPASTGVRSIVSLTRAFVSKTPGTEMVWTLPAEQDGYFSWSLALLAMVAAQETLK